MRKASGAQPTLGPTGRYLAEHLACRVRHLVQSLPFPEPNPLHSVLTAVEAVLRPNHSAEAAPSDPLELNELAGLREGAAAGTVNL